MCVCVCMYVCMFDFFLLLCLTLLQRSLSKQVVGVPSVLTGLNRENGRRHWVAPAARRLAGGGARPGGAGLVLQEQEQGFGVWSEPGHQACSDHGHRLLVTGEKRPEQSAVISRHTRTHTHTHTVLEGHISGWYAWHIRYI